MLSEQRYKEILNYLEIYGTIKTREICRIFKVSRETARRDLETMEEQGMLRRIHGGAMRLDEQQEKETVYTSFDERQQANSWEKEEIAAKALQFIHDGQSIALDSGTTNLALAKLLKGKFHSLTVVTNSLAVANELADCEGITLVMTGGIYHADEKAFVSDMATLIFAKINIDTFFLTACGVSAERGITYERMDEIIVQNAMKGVALKVIVIADSSKLGVASFVQMCGMERISAVITDSEATEEQIEDLKRAGVSVI